MLQQSSFSIGSVAKFAIDENQINRNHLIIRDLSIRPIFQFDITAFEAGFQ